jgi:cytochrome bd-type quinol oxidase subunit 2
MTADAATSNVFNAGGGVGSAIERDTGLANTNPQTATGTLINAVLGFLGLILVVLFIYAGVVWMTANGNEENITKAKTILSAAVIGLIIVFMSAGLARLVLTEAGNVSGINVNVNGAGTSSSESTSE